MQARKAVLVALVVVNLTHYIWSIDTPRIHDTRNDDNVPRARIMAINNMALIVTEFFSC